EGLKSLFPARTPETRPLSQDDDLAGFSDFNRTEFTLSPPADSEQRLFYLYSGKTQSCFTFLLVTHFFQVLQNLSSGSL
ncbi:hypothetical protein, partial [Thermincola ferriacetica]